MTITVSAMFIPVQDPDEALGFYRDALGLEVRNDVASGGFRWVTVGAPVAVGVPVMTPAVLIDSPAGRLVPVVVHVYGGVPPLTGTAYRPVLGNS